MNNTNAFPYALLSYMNEGDFNAFSASNANFATYFENYYQESKYTNE